MTNLPFNFNFDDVEILKALNNANHKLGQLNGAINLLPILRQFSVIPKNAVFLQLFILSILK